MQDVSPLDTRLGGQGGLDHLVECMHHDGSNVEYYRTEQ
jgi:hypothetical protein